MSLPPPDSPSRVYVGAGAERSLTSHNSLSSRWLCPFRHHWPDVVPRAVNATVAPSGDGAPQYSVAYRSELTAIGVPPSDDTRQRSFMPEMSLLDDEK